MTALAVAAGATTGIGLTFNVLLAPLYPAVLLAKQVITLAEASGGRLRLGLGVAATTTPPSASTIGGAGAFSTRRRRCCVPRVRPRW